MSDLSRPVRFGLIGAGIAVLAAWLCFFTVDEREQAVVLAFGNPQRVVKEPGLNFKLPPPFNDVVYFEDRVLPLQLSELEVIARDQRRIVVDAFARWRISDPLKFYQSVRTQTNAEARLNTNLNAALRKVLGDQNFTAVLTADRATLMERIRDETRASSANLGVEVVDVRIRRADLPEQNLNATYMRMNTERNREAADFRAKGQEAAQITRAAADREAVEMLSAARRDAEIIRGGADAERNHLISAAFSGDPEFYAFYRHLIAYEKVFKADGTAALLSPETNAFLRYFNNMNAAPAAPAAPR